MSASSWAVRVSSRVLPMAALASLSRVSRCRAQYRSLMSSDALSRPLTWPAGSRTGDRVIAQARSRGSPGAWWKAPSAPSAPWAR